MQCASAVMEKRKHAASPDSSPCIPGKAALVCRAARQPHRWPAATLTLPATAGQRRLVSEVLRNVCRSRHGSFQVAHALPS